jgi:hypothetical protein
VPERTAKAATAKPKMIRKSPSARMFPLQRFSTQSETSRFACKLLTDQGKQPRRNNIGGTVLVMHSPYGRMARDRKRDGSDAQIQVRDFVPISSYCAGV